MTLRSELADSPRLRIGLAFIALLVAVYGLLEWHDHQQRLVENYKRLAAEVIRSSARESMARWPQRSREALAVLDQHERRLWQQPSYGLAQAELQDWLRRQLLAINAQGATIRMSDAPSTSSADSSGAEAPSSAAAAAATPAPTRVSAQIEFASADPQILLALLAALGSEDRMVLVDSLTAKSQRVELRVSAWFRLAAPGARAT